MDTETALGAGGIASLITGVVIVIGKLIDKYKPRQAANAELGADYRSQIDFLNGQVQKLNADVDELREELRSYSKREHRLQLIIHRHCREHPECAPFFDSELGKMEVVN